MIYVITVEARCTFRYFDAWPAPPALQISIPAVQAGLCCCNVLRRGHENMPGSKAPTRDSDVNMRPFKHIYTYIIYNMYIYISWIWRASLLQYVYIYILYMYVCMYVSYIDVLYTGQMRSLQIRGSMRRPTLPHKGKYAMKCAHIDDHRCEIVWLSINLPCVFLFLFFSPSIPL